MSQRINLRQLILMTKQQKLMKRRRMLGRMLRKLRAKTRKRKRNKREKMLKVIFERIIVPTFYKNE